MTESNSPRRTALLWGLDSRLAGALSDALCRCNCAIGTTEAPADVLFCPASGDVIRQARTRLPGVPVIVVSPDSDQRRWLDALEAGANDYCTAPFEMIQLRWLLDRHAQLRRAQLPRAFAAA